jgi:hypothetical protein
MLELGVYNVKIKLLSCWNAEIRLLDYWKVVLLDAYIVGSWDSRMLGV